MTGFIPKEKLTAYQRWEVAAFDEAEQAARTANAAAATAAAKSAAEPPREVAPEPEQPPVVLPTAADIERMYSDAQEQGYAAGYEEGIAQARADANRIDVLLTGVQQSISELDQQVAERRVQNEKLQQRNDALEAEVRDLKTGTDAIEERARNELGMVKQDEVFFQILDRHKPAVTHPLSASQAAAASVAVSSVN